MLSIQDFAIPRSSEQAHRLSFPLLSLRRALPRSTPCVTATLSGPSRKRNCITAHPGLASHKLMRFSKTSTSSTKVKSSSLRPPVYPERSRRAFPSSLIPVEHCRTSRVSPFFESLASGIHLIFLDMFLDTPLSYLLFSIAVLPILGYVDAARRLTRPQISEIVDSTNFLCKSISPASGTESLLNKRFLKFGDA